MESDGKGPDKNLFRYLTGDITYDEWNALKRDQTQEGDGVEDVNISLRELTVVARKDGSTILTTGTDPSGQRAALQGPSGSGVPLVVATATSDGGAAPLLPTSQASVLQPPVQAIERHGDEEVIVEEVVDPPETEAPQYIKLEPVDPIGLDSGDDDDIIMFDPTTTMQYLKGEMPFEEYKRFLDSHIKEEPEDEEVPVDTFGLQVEVGPVLHEPEQQDVWWWQQDSLWWLQGAETQATSEPKEKQPRDRRPKGRKSKLPRALQGLMGEANMKFARGEHEEATKMCMEIIRLVPTAPEPFQTLGMLYEEKGDTDRALQFFLIAAHLNPSDSEEWVRLAELSLEMGNLNQAVSCYDKAIKYDATNMTYLWARCDLHEQQGERSKALAGYQQILKLLPAEDAEKYFQLARDICKSYHKLDQPTKAIETMEEAINKHPQSVSAEDINMLLELYMFTHEYGKPIEVLIQHCGLQLHLAGGDIITACSSERVELPEDMQEPERTTIPDEFPIDLRIKLVICLIHKRFIACHHELVSLILLESPEEVGDLYLDVAEAYMECGDYADAKPFLYALCHSEKYNLAAVWLRYAECLNSLSDLQAAAEAYERVVLLAPTHMEARVLLSALRQQQGEHEEALRVLDQEGPKLGETPAGIDLRLMIPRCNLLYSQGKTEDFIECAVQVLFGHFRDIFKKSHLAVILGNRSIKHRIYALRCVIGSSLDQRIKDASCMLLDNTVAVEDLWELYMRLGAVLVAQKRFNDLMELSITALMSPLFMNDTNRALETDFICLTACLLNKTSHFAYNFIREICVKQLNNNRAWNLFTQVISMSQDIRHNRYCLRLIIKHPDHHALGILNGHNAMVAGSYKHALGEYVCGFRRDTNDPLIILCIGNTFIHMACQKFSTCRHSLIIQGCAFLNQYMELRGECQETYYNMGRALHQIGLLSAAIYCYEKALEYGPALDEEPEIFDLSREIAFNLALIYQSSSSPHLASLILQKHLVI